MNTLLSLKPFILRRKLITYAVLLCISFMIKIPFSWSDSNQQQLDNVRKSISEQTKMLEQQKKQQQQLQQDLKKKEQAIAKVSQQLHKMNTSLATLEKQILSLHSEISALTVKQKEQQSALAKQVDVAFRLGRNSGIEMVLEPEKSQLNERILYYLQALSVARQQAITDLQQTQHQLIEHQKMIESKQHQQKNLLQQQSQQQKTLEADRQERQKVLVQLSKTVQQSESQLAQLKENEKQLQDKIHVAQQNAKRQAQKELADAEVIRNKQQRSRYQPTQDELALMARTSGIGKPKNTFIWPTKGKVIQQFGDVLQGQLRSKGMIIQAKIGQEVKAIASGRVILADWLQGYGLVIVLDHGKGDMSLYGYNESSLVNVGDKVETGQTISLVGDSGGQRETGLYFEIRREGRALNPLPWLVK